MQSSFFSRPNQIFNDLSDNAELSISCLIDDNKGHFPLYLIVVECFVTILWTAVAVVDGTITHPQYFKALRKHRPLSFNTYYV